MKTEHFGQYLVDYVRKTGKTLKMIGCTDEEIDALMKAQGVSELPEAYREYLETMGKKQGMFHPDPGATWEYEDLLRHKQLFEEDYGNEKHTMPEDSFIVYQALVTVFYYFRTGESEQGYPIYKWLPDDNADGTVGRNTKIADTIQEYFMKRVRAFFPPSKTIDADK